MKNNEALQNRQHFIEALQNAIDAEHAICLCIGRISSMIKDVIKTDEEKHKLFSLAELSAKNKDLMLNYLRGLGKIDFILEDVCHLCKLNTESFSLAGALNLALELIEISKKYYSDLLKLSEGPHEKALFKSLFTQKQQQKSFLKKEIGVINGKEYSQFIINYCIPHIVAKLSK